MNQKMVLTKISKRLVTGFQTLGFGISSLHLPSRKASDRKKSSHPSTFRSISNGTVSCVKVSCVTVSSLFVSSALISIVFVSSALISSALAWTPSLDAATAKAIVDGVYRRGPDVATSSSLNLSVKAGAFLAGPTGIEVYAGEPDCLSVWLTKPNEYATFGSRPTLLSVAGQSDYAKAAALEARDNFKSLTPTAALELARKRLPDGHLRVFMRIEGIAKEESRDAYQVGALDSSSKVVTPYKVTFLDDWAQQGGTWAGTMVYYFDLSKNRVSPTGTLSILIRTEAESDCAFKANLNLASFK
jgi:hypothetical protein